MMQVIVLSNHQNGINTHNLHNLSILSITQSVYVSLLQDLKERPGLSTYMVQVAVISNHQNGRDTHMRQIRVHSPPAPPNTGVYAPCAFTSLEMRSGLQLR